MDILTLLGVVSTGAAIVFYHLEPRHRLWVLGFALASLSSAVYAFLQGAWPFGVAEMFWFGVALHRYSLLQRGTFPAYVPESRPPDPPEPDEQLTPLAIVSPGSHCRAGYDIRPLCQRRQPSSTALSEALKGRVARVS